MNIQGYIFTYHFTEEYHSIFEPVTDVTTHVIIQKKHFLEIFNKFKETICVCDYEVVDKTIVNCGFINPITCNISMINDLELRKTSLCM